MPNLTPLLADDPNTLSGWIVAADAWLWGKPLLFLLLGAGLFFMLYSRFIPFVYAGHALSVLRGRYDNPDDPGQISHFQALCSALAGTVGMGNVSGVAVAIQQGGPGAVFWMWVCALLGMATKFFTCTAAVMFRGKDDQGEIQGGPMYVITEGLGRRWKPLAVMFAVFGLFGALPLFQANQLASLVRGLFYTPNGWFEGSTGTVNLGNGLIGAVAAIFVGFVIVGGIRRIGRVASWVVPTMILVYGICALIIVARHLNAVPASLALIFQDAFTGQAVVGGAVGVVIAKGVERAAFSNEAGLGTEALAHGAARTRQPVREGVVAMLGPAIDTILVCTLTALIILTTGVWRPEADLGEAPEGILMTSEAFATGFGEAGPLLLLLSVLFLSFSSMIGYSYYVTKCGAFLFGTRSVGILRALYLLAIVVAAIIAMDTVISFLGLMLGLMAIPTLVSALLLSPRIMREAKSYFYRLHGGEFERIREQRAAEETEEGKASR